MSRTVKLPPLSRRTLLRGALRGTGVVLGLPLLDAMLDGNGDALAAGGPLPMRFGVYYWGGGIVHSTWNPSQTGTGWTLPDSLTPFMDVRPYVTMVTGTNHRGSSPGHIPARGVALSSSHDLTVCQGDCVGSYRSQNMPEPTIDQIVMDAWKGQTLFDGLQIGICRKGPYASNTSWKRGGTTYNRHEPSPQRLWDRVFGGGAVGTGAMGAMATSTAYDKSMLDAVAADLTALGPRLGKSDQLRMQQHLDGVRSLEQRIQDRQRLAMGMKPCAKPDRPMRADFGDGGTHEDKEPKSQIMSDLLATAIACDLTRVFSYEFSAGQSQAYYWEVGVNQEHHQLNHDKPQGPEMQAITKFIMKNLAYLAGKLKALPEGTGNVLDRTLILGTSEHSIAGYHDWKDFPFILVGKAGGAIKAGLHYKDPNPNNVNAPRVLLTAIRAVGVNVPQIGQATGGEGSRVATDPIPDLMS